MKCAHSFIAMTGKSAHAFAETYFVCDWHFTPFDANATKILSGSAFLRHKNVLKPSVTQVEISGIISLSHSI